MQEYGKGSGYMVGDSVSKTTCTYGYKYMLVMMLHGQKTVKVLKLRLRDRIL